jgi:hypothetical protein
MPGGIVRRLTLLERGSMRDESTAWSVAVVTRKADVGTRLMRVELVTLMTVLGPPTSVMICCTRSSTWGSMY